MTTVFISYSHDSDEHKARIATLAQRLRTEGISTTLDSDKLPGGPDEGWPKWSERQVVEHDKVLVVCTRSYCLAYDASEPPSDGQGGLGAACEAMAIRQTIYKNRTINPKFRVVLADPADAAHIPINLDPYHRFELWRDTSVAELVAWLKPAPVPSSPAAGVCWPASLPKCGRGIANRDNEFACFERLLMGQGQQAVMLIRAASNRGKTVLVREFDNLLHAAGVEHCIVDLKGSRSIDAVLDGLLTEAEKLLPELARAAAGQRPSALLRDLKSLSTPLVLCFDTYEHSDAEVANWLETQILQRIDRFPALRIVIAGQKVPVAERSVWARYAASFDLSPISEEQPWVRYGSDNFRHVPEDVMSNFIAGLVRATGGDPATISGMLKGLAESYADGGRP